MHSQPHIKFTSCCVFKYPAAYIIGSAPSRLHANKQNRNELNCHLLQGTATTDDKDISVTKQLHVYPPTVAPAKANESWSNDIHAYGLMLEETYCQWICDVHTLPDFKLYSNASVCAQLLGHPPHPIDFQYNSKLITEKRLRKVYMTRDEIDGLTEASI